MKAILSWSLESTLILSVLFLIYFLCFRNNTSIRLRRNILQAIVLISIFSPLLKVNIPRSNSWAEHPIIQIDEKLIARVTTATPEEPLPSSEPIESVKSSTDYRLATYLVGAAIFLLVLLFQISRLALIMASGKWEWNHRSTIISHRLIKAPSSFLFAILMPEKLSIDAREEEIIIEHEKQHIQQKHSIDLLALSALQVFTWYNPLLFWIRSEFKNIHEALADRATLERIDTKEYFRVLLASAFTLNTFSLSHCFGQTQGLLKRIQLIKKQQTTMKKTTFSMIIFSMITFGTIGINILKAQENKSEGLKKEDIEKMTGRERADYIVNLRAKEEGYPAVSSREEALELTKKDKSYTFATNFFIRNKLTKRFEDVLERLEKIYPDSDISYTYLDNPAELDYSSYYFDIRTPLYIGELSIRDKDELIELAHNDTLRAQAMRFSSKTYPVHYFSILELGEEINDGIRHDASYIMFYESKESEDSKIYDAKEVDILPTPVGGMDAFERAIALDISIPETIKVEDLPETIDYSVVVYGGRQINNVNLLTEVTGKGKNDDDLYLFYGQILKQIQNKTRAFYSWKNGMKDGKVVRVKMTISIPTKYML